MRLVGKRETAGVPPPMMPVPVRLTVWGLSLALSVIVRVPVRVPVAAGENVTLMPQFAPAATELPQVFVSAKSPAFVPVIAMIVMFSVALPSLVSVSLSGELITPTT